MTSKSPKKRSLISRWTIVFMLLTVPFVLFYAKDRSTPEYILNDLLKCSQSVGGVHWRLKFFIYRTIPRNVSRSMGLKFPGRPESDQIQALVRLKTTPSSPEAKIPALTNVLSSTTIPIVLVLACENLGALGTNASGALPLLLSLHTQHLHGSVRPAPLRTASQVAPGNSLVLRLIWERMQSLISSTTLPVPPRRFPQQLSWESAEFVSLTYMFFRSSVNTNELHHLFTGAVRSNQPQYVRCVLKAFSSTDPKRNSHFKESAQSLVRQWQEMRSAQLRQKTYFAAFNVALHADANLALQLYRDALQEPKLHPTTPQKFYRKVTQIGAPSVTAEATQQTVDRIEKIASHDEWDAGSWIDVLQWQNPMINKRIESWLHQRAIDSNNPHQDEDRERHARHFGKPNE